MTKKTKQPMTKKRAAAKKAEPARYEIVSVLRDEVDADFAACRWSNAEVRRVTVDACVCTREMFAVVRRIS